MLWRRSYQEVFEVKLARRRDVSNKTNTATYRMGNHPPHVKACTLHMSQIGVGSVLNIPQRDLMDVTMVLFVQENPRPGRVATNPSSSRILSSTEKIVMACATTRVKLAKTERILIWESPRNEKWASRFTFPIQKPRMDPMPELSHGT